MTRSRRRVYEPHRVSGIAIRYVIPALLGIISIFFITASVQNLLDPRLSDHGFWLGFGALWVLCLALAIVLAIVGQMTKSRGEVPLEPSGQDDKN